MEKVFSWKRAIIAGILATIGFDVVMYIDIAINPNNPDIPAMLGTKLIGEENGGIIFGHIGHFINGILLAIIFAALNPYIPGKNAVVKALLFSTVETIFGVWMLVLPLLGAGFAGMLAPGALWLVTLIRHIGYGAVLGAAYRDVEVNRVPVLKKEISRV